MSNVAVPESARVTTVATLLVVSPPRVAVTMTSTAASVSPIESGTTDRVMLLGGSSSSVMVVVTEVVAPRDGVGPVR